jgi:hypothetical protein
MDPIQEHVDRTLSKARRWWFIHALVAVPVLWLLLSGWWLLLIPIYLSATYQAAIFFTVQALISTIPHDLLQLGAQSDAMRALGEIKQRLDDGEIEPGPELYELMNRAGYDLSVIEGASDALVGRYQDADIHEWVELYDPDTKKVERFFFEEVAATDASGAYLLPSIERKRTACVNGLIYARPLQPAQA